METFDDDQLHKRDPRIVRLHLLARQGPHVSLRIFPQGSVTWQIYYNAQADQGNADKVFFNNRYEGRVTRAWCRRYPH